MKKILIVVGVVFVIAITIFIWLEKRITFSIVVPVYNAEKYLERSLDSIFSQKGSFEVIAINDGSTDRSVEILQKYSQKYPNLKIISQENKGVSAARNAGLKIAKNKYVTFVDADDWLEPNVLNRAAEILNKDKSDVLLTGFYDVYDHEWIRQVRGEDDVNEVSVENRFPNRNLDKLQLFSPFYGLDAYSDLFYIGGGVRARFFRKSFLNKHKIQFPDNINIHEDDIFLFRTFLNNPLISVLSVPFYNYRNRADSLSKSEHVVENMEKSLAYMQNSSEFKQAPRQTQMLIEDSWLSLVMLGVANIQRHRAPLERGLHAAQKAYGSFSKYNKEEQKSCRNFQKLKRLLYQNDFNQAL